MKKFKKVLILGSGALKIGQAGEFDYSGSQAIKALKEEGIKTVLINPNIATIQTSHNLADKVYFLPVNAYFVEEVIEKEKPDGILLSFGGQTALNCGVELFEKKILEKHNVEIIGTPIKAVILTEDREKFAKHLKSIDVSTPISKIAFTLEEALKQAEEIRYPVMIRAGFALGGEGSGVAKNERELRRIVTKALNFAPQVLIEQYLHHFKEIEYEVVRDSFDNCITVCNMENMDPLGIHTGDSIVVAPSQTLNNQEFHLLRETSIKIVRSLGIVGECNVQFALNPEKMEYFVIEVNARLSRSSALASKATGYPLAYVAAKLGLGYSLVDLKNSVTRVTSACFEPALDYLVVKIPRWDLEKFKNADQKLGSSMKSVGEVMGIGRTFEEAYQKAIRMLDLDYEGATSERIFEDVKTSDILNSLKFATPARPFIVAKALKNKISVNKLHKLTGIDEWFLYRIKNIVDKTVELKHKKELTYDVLLDLKQIGFSDRGIGRLVNKTGLEIREVRQKMGIIPSVLKIDTLAGEFPAQTNYLYMTYNANHNDVKKLDTQGVIILGSGPYRIGASVEFDWSCVNTVTSLKKYNKKSVVINCNPETVSTDYDVSDRLYFEELTFERIADIYEFENPLGVIVSVGGQTPNNRADALNNFGFNILGTQTKSIDTAENRSKFSALLDKLNIKQPAWKQFTTLKEAEKFCEKVGYPVLIRPSYVLSGSAMNICFSKYDLEQYLAEATKISNEYPITVSKFFESSKEIEYDGVAQKGRVISYVISEHIENAGVHSGDATIVLPTADITDLTKKKIISASFKMVKQLKITGPFNIQFLAKDDEVYVIELNLRASRTFPFIAKVTGVNLIKLFVDSLFIKSVKEVKVKELNFVAVKVPQFSFSRITGADLVPGVEMASTGEVACFGEDVEEAALKGLISVGFKVPSRGIYMSVAGKEKKEKFLEVARNLMQLHLPMYASSKTADFLIKNNIPVAKIHKIHEKKLPNTLNLMLDHKIDLIINIVDKSLKKDLEDDFILRRTATESNIFVMTKLNNTKLFVSAMVHKKLKDLKIKSWDEYLK